MLLSVETQTNTEICTVCLSVNTMSEYHTENNIQTSETRFKHINNLIKTKSIKTIEKVQNNDIYVNC